ncbi:E3 ubiquitin-protein ligase RNF14-like [Parasteatoda tepidariorum]|uniref:E3 ubiquitin-protein ligase RNF14-like n=1 Tax=Parasteatoda tepidariorum TaxID=114398 RepID=UPI00077FB34F|nr:E3 ubiquitin-protein ligase RNF14-like [Parasteatoda tepidariorum]
MDNLSQQKEELSAVESIFNVYEKNLTFEDQIPVCGHFKANVWLPTPFYVTYNIENIPASEIGAENSDTKNSRAETFKVENLPPINLFFEFPDSYPSETCPAFLLSCNWLSLAQISELCKHLESLWDKDMPVLYSWCQFLESEVAEFYKFDRYLDVSEILSYKGGCNFRNSKNSTGEFKESNNTMAKDSFMAFKPSISGGEGLIDVRALNDIADGRSLINLLKSYDNYKTADIFNRKFHECDICMTTKLGADFAAFKICKHSFCKECLKEFFEVHIREGNVNCLNCPSEKCNTQADGTMVQQIVDKGLFERYDDILLSRTLETMSDIAYCPRKSCQCAVLIDLNDRIGRCPQCTFAFCPYCKMAYHGVAPCTFKSEQKKAIFEQYMSGDSEVKEQLEKRHGKRAIKALVEDSLSESWKNSNSKSCPSCKASIEKSDGCNKMTCFKCATFFCWECMKILESSNPYFHFNALNARCTLFPDDELDNQFEFEPGEFLHFL